MRMEHFWMDLSTAEEWKKTGAHQVLLSTAPATMLDGTHAFRSLASGDPRGDIYHDEATGCYVAIDMNTKKLIVFTHQGENPKLGPTRASARKVGEFDRDALAIVCAPAGPHTFQRGPRGVANYEIADDEQLKAIDSACDAAKLPRPRLAGRPVTGLRWNDPKVAERLKAMALQP